MRSHLAIDLPGSRLSPVVRSILQKHVGSMFEEVWEQFDSRLSAGCKLVLNRLEAGWEEGHVS